MEKPIRAGFAWHGAGEVQWVTDKAAWLGRAGSPEYPAGLSGEIHQSETPRWDDPVAVGLVNLTLAPGETRKVVHVVGASTQEGELVSALSGWTVERAEQSLVATHSYWSERCAQNPYLSSNEVANLLVNSWFPYQAIAGRIYGRPSADNQHAFLRHPAADLSLSPSAPHTTSTLLVQRCRLNV